MVGSLSSLFVIAVLLIQFAFVFITVSSRGESSDNERKTHESAHMLHEERLAKMRKDRIDYKRNSNGHRVLENFDNGTIAFEVDDNGEIPTRRLSTTVETSISEDTSMVLNVDPPNGAMTPHGMAVYVYCSDENARIYYETDGTASVSLSSAYATRKEPYIHLGNPYGVTRTRTLDIICVSTADDSTRFRSSKKSVTYYVEADARKYSYGFLVPGVESDGHFLKFRIEATGESSVETAGKQEMTDPQTRLGMGPFTVPRAVHTLKLNDLMAEMTGFEGGVAVNCTNGRQYGILIPNHNGEKFTGVVVRVDLVAMDYEKTAAASDLWTGHCITNWMHEKMSGNTIVKSTSAGANASDPCIHSLDLTTLHADARGFRRGFAHQPYVYLSPGEFNIPVRLDVCNFGLSTTEVIDLTPVRNDSLGGYSGGFSDGPWACFNPFRTFAGPFGGKRSTEAVDNGHLRPYYHGEVLCIHEDGWVANTVADLNSNIRTFDLSLIHAGLRGFSEAVKVGRYAYLCPLAERPNAYSFRLVRVYLGEENIGAKLSEIDEANGEVSAGKLRDIVEVLDLRQVDTSLAGFSGLFYSGKYLFLVPYRSENSRANGLRGHGKIVRVDMNIFDVGGTDVLDLTTVTRNQIPSFPDEDLRGFSGGFASGKYALLVPFYNAIFSGKLARLQGLAEDMSLDLQALNFTQDIAYDGMWKGYRSGFVSLWQGDIDRVFDGILT